MNQWDFQRHLALIAVQTWYQVQQLLRPEMRESARSVTEAFNALQDAITSAAIAEANREREAGSK